MSNQEEDLGAGCTDEMPLDLEPGTLSPGDETCYFRVWDGGEWIAVGQVEVPAVDGIFLADPSAPARKDPPGAGKEPITFQGCEIPWDDQQ